jgi:hypothetical protein
MMQTIVTSSHISVQGEVVKRLANGMVIIRVGTSEYIGRPVAAVRKMVSSSRKPEMA